MSDRSIELRSKPTPIRPQELISRLPEESLTRQLVNEHGASCLGDVIPLGNNRFAALLTGEVSQNNIQ